ncbi:hypothetical protein [Amycolatopsis sp. H20-H5]|uniref:hypothetical protein n=1 Tax=Amycolatopsis sp. H20-H5 TaxID=3046309 RepID=UPI002DB9A6F5|nr:hypothetical protein [Amycolatopsis sp. H20-H5]MEC3974505.1 hypothetical protein [Amycolatopsis sp. H20-H5]
MLLAVLTPSLPSFARGPDPWEVKFNQSLYGDFVLAGNAVMTCPTSPANGVGVAYPPSACADAQQRKGEGLGALNNSHAMIWSDIDKDDTTFNSSSARVAIPSGATVAYAQLGWAGDVGRKEGAPCGRGKSKPPGTPEKQAVSLTVNDGKPTLLEPSRFTMVVDDPARLAATDQQFYSAQSDVTTEFAQAQGDTTVTVGNVWTPEGNDCFGGWTLTVVWKFVGPTAQHAPAKKNVVVYGGHVRVSTATSRVQIVPSSMHAAGGSARIGLSAYEGDWATAGDQFLVNGVAQGDREKGIQANNFFTSHADGSVKPDVVNNMSVDATTVTASDQVIRPGATSAQVAFTRRDDAYLVQSMVVAFPLPELTVTTRPDHSVVHPGDAVVQSVSVANVGGAPAGDVSVRVGSEPTCVRKIGALAAGAASAVTCDLTAEGDDYTTEAKVTGQSLAGDALAAGATSAVEVLRPAVQVSQTAEPATVLDGQSVQVKTLVRNTGDTPLSGLALHNNHLAACDRTDLAAVAPGQTASADCVVIASGDGATNTATVTAGDKLERQVSATTDAAFTVVHPLLALAAVWSADRAARGERVTITVTAANPSTVPFQDVEVIGEPAPCRRALGTLQPGQRIEYTCEITIESDVDTELRISGVPVVNGVPFTDARAMTRVTGFASVRISLSPIPVTPSPQPAAAAVTPQPAPAAVTPQPPPVEVAKASPMSKPAVGAIAAVLAMVSMVLVVSATSGLGKS